MGSNRLLASVLVNTLRNTLLHCAATAKPRLHTSQFCWPPIPLNTHTHLPKSPFNSIKWQSSIATLPGSTAVEIPWQPHRGHWDSTKKEQERDG